MMPPVPQLVAVVVLPLLSFLDTNYFLEINPRGMIERITGESTTKGLKGGWIIGLVVF
jgi:hypothetical protein